MFIVYASLNLSHNVVVPAATWLFVCVFFRFHAVDSRNTEHHPVRHCDYLVYSREPDPTLLFAQGGATVVCMLEWSQRRIVMNLLATHPVAYFYYVVILGGIVWNVLGSGWIGAAYKYYNHAFAVCYLVCIILSWVSVILSPTFVLCGTTRCSC